MLCYRKPRGFLVGELRFSHFKGDEEKLNIFGPEIIRTLEVFAVLLISVYIGIAMIILIFQTNFVYAPHKEMVADPGKIGLAFENVRLCTRDGVRLFGWFIPGKKNNPVILFCHGKAGNISHRLDTIRIFNRMGLSVFIFDYRGYGLSDGKPTEKGTYWDAEAAWEYLTHRRRIPSSEIIVFGRSLGGAIAAWLAHIYKPKVLIVESAFTSIQDIAAEMFPLLPVRKFSVIHYNTTEYIHAANCPVMIIHSRQDETVPFWHADELFQAAGEPKTFLEISGRHNDGYRKSGRVYEHNIKKFIEQNDYSKISTY